MVSKLGEEFSISQREHRFSISFRYAIDAALCYRLLHSESRQAGCFTVDKPITLQEQSKRRHVVRLSWHGRVSEDFLSRDFSRREMQKRWHLSKR